MPAPTATAAEKIFGACLRKLCRAARARLHSANTVELWNYGYGWLSPLPATQRVAGDRGQWRYDIIHGAAANAAVELDNIYFSFFSLWHFRIKAFALE